MPGLSEPQIAILAGLAGGIVLGLAARVGRYCIMGAVEDAVYGGDLGRMRMLAMSAGVAIAGAFALIEGGVLDPNVTRYYRIPWSPAGSVLGGLMFGYGMALVGTCGFGALARAGGGDLRGLIMAAVVGVAAYATTGGPLAGFRTWLVPPVTQADGVAEHGIAHGLAALLGVPTLLPALLAAGALVGWAVMDPRFRRPGRHLVWSAAVGLAVVFGWTVTARLAAVSFDPVEVEAYSFVAPIGQGLLYVMTAANTPDFAIAAVGGVIAGAAIGSLFQREFRWEACDDARELRRQILGAAMMGVGGVLAVGCTIGQGLSAMSLLSASAPVTVLSILAGARLGLFVLVEGAAVGR